jgi:hypothetical protein
MRRRGSVLLLLSLPLLLAACDGTAGPASGCTTTATTSATHGTAVASGRPRVSSCSASYSSSGRTVSGLKATTDPGATVLLAMQVDHTVYPFLGSAVADADGLAVFPDPSSTTSPPPSPPGSR